MLLNSILSGGRDPVTNPGLSLGKSGEQSRAESRVGCMGLLDRTERLGQCLPVTFPELDTPQGGANRHKFYRGKL